MVIIVLAQILVGWDGMITQTTIIPLQEDMTTLTTEHTAPGNMPGKGG